MYKGYYKRKETRIMSHVYVKH